MSRSGKIWPSHARPLMEMEPLPGLVQVTFTKVESPPYGIDMAESMTSPGCQSLAGGVTWPKGSSMPAGELPLRMTPSPRLLLPQPACPHQKAWKDAIGELL